MAHTKSGGSTKLGRDSRSKRLGVKINEGELAHPGEIIIRQLGTRYLPGRYVAQGADDTLYALKAGVVRFSTKRKTRFDGKLRSLKLVTLELARSR